MFTQGEERNREVITQVKAAKEAAGKLSGATTGQKNQALLAMADAIWRNRQEILVANQQDVQDAQAAGQTASKVDRLQLNEKRLQDMMEGLRKLIELTDPIGELLETILRPDGLLIEKVRVPLGVIAMIYESRPNVTVDAAGLALKTGNAVVLRGGKEALRSNAALVKALKEGLEAVHLPTDAFQFINRTERESVDDLIQARGLVDLVIPRGGAGLIERVVKHSLVPVIETGVGNCHVYVDKQADLQKADAIVINAKTQRPSVCNAMETLLVHADIAEQWLPVILAQLMERGVEIRACERARAALAGNPQLREKAVPATDADWSTEFLDLIMNVKIVADVNEAIQHINTYGTLHSEAIVTEDPGSAQIFLQQVDAAAVYHNASTRFTDGFEFGFGAEIGISTQKLHARGPMGLKEMTSYKYLIKGNGQIRV
ncbi:glutamate-5-semialdehyde dehydrogenase [Fodinisporobacter ferrooxydans]|uniref:Gamma-glutamyl phosphate reductase n=1 Tax=Fodinisporobacter ferrooxydans TaxID=2901836 RepID=A0ABY4CJJ0_9BACL|nr:glutamate-5-semialdehyde dehydrogenase [Alicyclobacillaceae bacterium MYW30-H2]